MTPLADALREMFPKGFDHPDTWSCDNQMARRIAHAARADAEREVALREALLSVEAIRQSLDHDAGCKPGDHTEDCRAISKMGDVILAALVTALPAAKEEGS